MDRFGIKTSDIFFAFANVSSPAPNRKNRCYVRNMNKFAVVLIATLTTLVSAIALAPSASGDATPVVCTDELYPPQTSSELGRWISGLPKGAIGCLHAGTYGDGGQVYINPSSEGTSRSDRRKVRNYPGDRLGDVTVNGGFYFDDSADFYTLRLFDVDGSSYGDDTIGLSQGADHVNLADLDVTNGNRSGIHGCITNGGSYLIIVRDRIHDCGGDTHFDHCVYLGHGALAQVVDNVIYNCATWAIHLYTNPDGAYIHNNILTNSGGGVLFAGGTYQGACEATDGARVENNAITNMNGARDHDEAVTTSWGCSPQGQNNLLAANCFYGNAYGNVRVDSAVETIGNVVADPLFGSGLTIPLVSGCYPLVGDPASVLHDRDDEPEL